MATYMTTMDALLRGIGDHYHTAGFPSDFLRDARDIPSELSIESPSETQQGVSKEESGPRCQISYTELMRINGQSLMFFYVIRLKLIAFSFSFTPERS